MVPNFVEIDRNQGVRKEASSVAGDATDMKKEETLLDHDNASRWWTCPACPTKSPIPRAKYSPHFYMTHPPTYVTLKTMGLSEERRKNTGKIMRNHERYLG